MLGDRARADIQRASDGTIGAPERGETQDPDLPVGEVGEVGEVCEVRWLRELALPGTLQRRHQRQADDVQEVSIVLGEVPRGTVERDADNLRPPDREPEPHLVLHTDPAEILAVQVQALEVPVAEEVADHDRVRVTGFPVVVDQGMLMDVGGERRLYTL